MRLDWQLGYSESQDSSPARWVPASVPGAAALDWARAEGWPSHVVGENSSRYRWMEDVWWTYRTRFVVPKPEPGGAVRFVAHGVDYRHDLLVNGARVHSQEGLYRPSAADLGAHAGREVEICVKVHPAPKSRPEPDDRRQANVSFKPPVSYGWDFHPRLVPLGLCDEAEVVVRPALRLEELAITHELLADYSAATLVLRAQVVAAEGALLRWTVLAPDGIPVLRAESAVVAGTVSLAAVLQRPQLWWPRGHGAQPLYTHRVELVDAAGAVRDARDKRTGFRRSRLVMYPGQWDIPGPGVFPKPRTEPPFTLEINGRPIFAKGANWVAPDIFYGGAGRAEYEPLLRLACEANFNLLRCWGGAPVMKEAFFELADELGLMLWQEFTLACNAYPDDPAYLGVVDRESRFLITRLRRHPSLVIWCGGNELFNKWSGMDDQALVLRLLNRNCFELDPLTPFLPTSPVGGVAHGHYVLRDAGSGREAWEMFQSAAYNAYTEFGVPAAANAEVLREVIPQAELWPPASAGAWRHHHAFESWTAQHHLCLDTLKAYFGPIDSLEKLVELSQWTQGEGLRGVYEEARRQSPRCSMALAWCFNEPWPAAANLSLVCWPARPKASLRAVAQACRPVLASARIPRFQWRPGETFEAELWMLNDSPDFLEAFALEASLEVGAEVLQLARWEHGGAEAGRNLRGPSVRAVLPATAETRFRLRLAVAGRPALGSVYELSLGS